MEVKGIIGIFASYFLGSVVPGLWLPRWFHGVDIRKLGSGNIGSTNVYRIFGWKLGLIVQVIDISKAVLAIVIAKGLGMPGWMEYACATAAIVGHMYPVFAGFSGGKGVNTLLGAMLVLKPLVTLMGVGIFLIVLGALRYVSMASMVSVASFPILCALTGENHLWVYGFGVAWAGLVVYAHRQNIIRLIRGTEPRVSFLRT
ncbi:MAG: glycerol-3-phosphate 1-O-acyltransferase PlsY [Bacteroidia bacterium]